MLELIEQAGQVAVKAFLVQSAEAAVLGLEYALVKIVWLQDQIFTQLFGHALKRLFLDRVEAVGCEHLVQGAGDSCAVLDQEFMEQMVTQEGQERRIDRLAGSASPRDV